VICAIPLTIHRSGAPFGSGGYDAAIAVLGIAVVALSALFLRRVRATFDDELETVLERF